MAKKEEDTREDVNESELGFIQGLYLNLYLDVESNETFRLSHDETIHMNRIKIKVNRTFKK